MVIYHANGVRHIRWNISRNPSYGFIGVRTHIGGLWLDRLLTNHFLKTWITQSSWVMALRGLAQKMCPETGDTTLVVSRKRINDTCFFSPNSIHIFFPESAKKCVYKRENQNKFRFSTFWKQQVSFLLFLDTEPPNGHISCHWGQTYPLEHLPESIIRAHRGWNPYHNQK